MSQGRHDLPDGTVTMVFTDIAGSTELLAQLGEGYGAVLADHRRAVRAVAARHHGVEVDTQGDAFFLVFSRASDAVSAAREVAGDADGVRVRIGVHTGEPSRTEEGYVGMDVHLAARIAASGSGGQVLLSRQTRELVPGEAMRDLGVHRLKDVGDVHLYQVGDVDFPPVRSLGGGNIAAPREAPLGRDRELNELRDVIAGGARLVTLTGPGGIGKTTVARALAAVLGDRFADGTWFVDLSAVGAADLVEPAVAAAVGSHAGVAEHLQSRTALVILDNMEQIVDAAPLVSDWLERCERLAIVATSRQPLQLSQEREYSLAPLDDETATQLFRRRAQAQVPAFDAGEHELVPLCRRLDGMPLAIELAAARVRMLTPGQLLARIDERFALLTGGPRDVAARQRTLEATIAWSYDLLEREEQELFARLAVFAGGWTLEAAEVVAAADVDVLESLVVKSLVRFDQGRFSMLESIRAYAAGRLATLPDAPVLRRAHAGYYAGFVARVEPELTGAEQDAWLEVLARDEDNLRAALDWCAAEAPALGLELAAGMVLFWYLRSRPVEGMERVTSLLAMTEPADSLVRAKALWGAGFFLAILGDPAASGYLAETLAMSGRIGDRSLSARSLDLQGIVAFFGNDLDGARSLLEQSISEARAAGDDWCLADALGTIGSVYPLMGELELGRSSSEEGLRLARGRRDLQGTRMSLFGVALTARRTGDGPLASQAAGEGLEISRQLRDAFFASYFLWILASVELEIGDLAGSAGHADEALRLAREVGAPLLVVCALEARAAASRAEGDDVLARSLLAEAESISDSGLVPGSYVSEALRALGRLDADEGDRASAERRLGRAVEIARSVRDGWAERRAVADLEQLAQSAN